PRRPRRVTWADPLEVVRQIPARESMVPIIPAHQTVQAPTSPPSTQALPALSMPIRSSSCLAGGEKPAASVSLIFFSSSSSRNDGPASRQSARTRKGCFSSSRNESIGSVSSRTRSRAPIASTSRATCAARQPRATRASVESGRTVVGVCAARVTRSNVRAGKVRLCTDTIR
ncbi:unnamed protein product, partial [Ectocarpus fasciculatus]